MKFIQGYDRNQIQLFPVSLEESIGLDNEVRMIDMFVESLPLKKMGFGMEFIENGRPAYHPADLLKLFIYGYLNKIRSSRDLEKECKRNIEVIWLLKGLSPDHNTISNFRRDNSKAIRKVFQATVKVARHFNLIGGKLLAGDSTKLRAQNSKKNNFNPNKIEQHIAYIDKKLEEYSSLLASDERDVLQAEERTEIQKKVAKHQEQKQKYETMQKELDATGATQISTSDPESRQMIIRNNITEVAYNVQTTVDSKHNIPIDYKVTNENDSKAMGSMVRRAKTIIGHGDFTALYDKGYHTGSELKTAQELGVETLVAIPNIPLSSQAPDPSYNVSEFYFDSQANTYSCPQGYVLTTNGNWYRKDRRKDTIRVKHYKTTACKSCQLIHLCTKNTGGRGRVIERSEFANYIDVNRKNMKEKERLYKRRQAIVEHPFGTIKRQWGFYFISTKRGLNRASADVGLMFTAYNLRRIINIIGIEAFRRCLLAFAAHLCSILTSFKRFWRIQNPDSIFFTPKNNVRISQIIANLAMQFCNEMKLERAY